MLYNLIKTNFSPYLNLSNLNNSMGSAGKAVSSFAESTLSKVYRISCNFNFSIAKENYTVIKVNNPDLGENSQLTRAEIESQLTKDFNRGFKNTVESQKGLKTFERKENVSSEKTCKNFVRCIENIRGMPRKLKDRVLQNSHQGAVFPLCEAVLLRQQEIKQKFLPRIREEVTLVQGPVQAAIKLSVLKNGTNAIVTIKKNFDFTALDDAKPIFTLKAKCKINLKTKEVTVYYKPAPAQSFCLMKFIPKIIKKTNFSLNNFGRRA